MTNKEIKKNKKELYDIIMKKNGSDIEKGEQLRTLADKLNTPIPVEGLPTAFVDKTTRNIHITLQTEEMFNACVSAKWSCFWAAVAAIVACTSIILTMCLN